MCDFFQTASSLRLPKQVEVPTPQSTTMVEGQDSVCDITCALGSSSREIFDFSCKAQMHNRKVHENFKR